MTPWRVISELTLKRNPTNVNIVTKGSLKREVWTCISKLTWRRGHIYQCEYCQKRFTENGNLKRHIRIHMKEKAYQCEYWQKWFIHKSTLKRHIRTHTNEKPYQCEYCCKGFTRSGYLKLHMSHTKEKPYQCEYCQDS